MDFGGSVQTSLFAYGLMAVVSMLAAVMVQGIVVVLQKTQKKPQAAPTPVSISVAPAVNETEAHVAAVAAAVYAILGGHRLVHIGDAGRAPGWAAYGRTLHHTSHAPRRSGR